MFNKFHKLNEEEIDTAKIILKNRSSYEKLKYMYSVPHKFSKKWVSDMDLEDAKNVYIKSCKENVSIALRIDMASNITFMINNKDAIGLTVDNIDSIESVWETSNKSILKCCSDSKRFKILNSTNDKMVYYYPAYKYGGSEIKNYIYSNFTKELGESFYNMVIDQQFDTKHVAKAKLLM